MLVLSALLAVGLEYAGLPAALLIGPLLAAVVVAVTAGPVEIPAPSFLFAQGIIGLMMAHSVPVSIAGEMARDWPLFVAGVLSVMVVAAALGWMLARWHVLPGTTAIWGSSPGAATAMMIMAEAHGADIRLVAFMQYLRVVCVALVASVVARFWVGSTGDARPQIDWFPAVAWLPVLETLLVIGAGVLLARVLRLSAGALLLPLILGLVLQHLGWVTITLPPWLLAIAYALVGWSIGLRFTRPILVHVARALPRVLASTLALIAICGLLAACLVVVAGIDPLTAYLATSPGGADSVAIIAASSKVDMPFVMAMQTMRLFLVLVTGPSVARFIAGRVSARDRAQERAEER
ncbi:AbrB family transcriptional regulator [Bradyrhizobium prioriisuperbiae]|uniref:AbrB family transcriptional regulator n=1 Tax=Bradyrhizobium prioriisuperbiae TaxID=2854389 RepID=UPI0028F04BDB|nr:AbrB family transcriptional regulator [Bradyrhizobium prioritasuperba]